MNRINRNQSGMAVPAVLCSTTDVSQGNYNRIITEKMTGQWQWVMSAIKTRDFTNNTVNQGGERIDTALGLEPLLNFSLLVPFTGDLWCY